ncbi:MAG: Sec-independent protein translocase protein TatB [Thermodesulfobacteriota bacterium]
MFGIGMTELLVILGLALLVIGPKKLPEVAKALGRGFAEFRKATQEVKDTLDREIHAQDFKAAVKDVKKEFSSTMSQAADLAPGPSEIPDNAPADRERPEKTAPPDKSGDRGTES